MKNEVGTPHHTCQNVNHHNGSNGSPPIPNSPARGDENQPPHSCPKSVPANQNSKIKNQKSLPREMAQPMSSGLPASSRFEAVQGHAGSAPAPRYSLTKGLGVWRLIFEGRDAILKHELGLAYIAYLLFNPPDQPIHGLALALRVKGASGMDPIQERNLALDDAEAAHALYRKQIQLENLVDDGDQTDPVKEEAQRELLAIYDFQNKNLSRTNNTAQKAADAVGKALKRLHTRLAGATTLDDQPHLDRKSFAQFIRQFILIPSGRLCGHGGLRSINPAAGCFTYTPPPGVVWEK